MFNRLLITVLIAFFYLQVPAQITQNLEKPDLEYKRALQSFEKKLYNKSIKGFERYLQTAIQDEYQHEAEYYIASSKLRLRQTSALEYAEKFINAHPYSQRVDFINKEIGDFYFNNKRYKSAARYYKKVPLSILDKDETDEFLFRKGYSLFEAGKYDEAKDALYPLTLRPTANYAKAMYYYGYVCYMNKDYKEALDAFLKIEDKGPQTMKLYICQIYYLKGEYQKAIDYANKVNLGKLDDEKMAVIAKSYYRLRNFEKASEAFSKAFVSYDYLTEDELYEVGYTYFKTGACNKAFIAFTKIANKGTALGQISSYHMGECFVKNDKKLNAYNAFFEAQRTDFDKEVKENAMFNMAKLAYELEDYKTAIATFDKFIELFPQSELKRDAQKKLAQLFLVTTDYKSAIPILENIPNLDRESQLILHQILILRGEELMLQKQIAEANEIFTKAANLRSNLEYTAIANFWLGEIKFAQNNKPEAIRLYQAFVTNNEAKSTPYFNYAHYAIGYANFDLKKYAEAQNFFNRFIALNRQNPGEMSLVNDATLRVADCNYSLGNYAAALDNYAFISSKKAPGSDYALFQEGMILGIQNKSRQKIDMMRRIGTEHPNSIFVEHSIFEVASEWVQLNNFSEAERNFRYLLEDFPNSMYVRRSLLALGVMYYTQEKDDQALTEFKMVVTKHPGTVEARTAISYIERIYVSRGESAKYLSWLETVPNSGISVSFRDSVSYQGAFNLYMNNNCPGAITGFKNYLTEFPQGFFNISARFYLGTCLDKVESKAASVPYYRNVVATQANEFKEEASKRLAVYYYGVNNFDSSLYFYGRLESFSSDKQNLMDALLGQVRSAYETSNLDVAQTKGQRLLRMDNVPVRVQGEVNNKIGILYYERKDYSKANEYFSITLKNNKDEYGAEAYYFTAQILHDRLFSEQAKTMVFDYSKQFGSFDYWQARCFLLLTEIYNKEGDKFQARATLNFVVDTYKDVDIQNRAADLKKLIDG